MILYIKETVSDASRRWNGSQYSGSSSHHTDEHSKRKREMYVRMLVKMLLEDKSCRHP